MGGVRVAVGSLLLATGGVASTPSCTPEHDATQGEVAPDPAPVPDPPPRYARVVATDAAAADPDAASELQIKCGRDKPYVCPLDDDAGFACSSIPCLPDCTRIGCVGGDVCTACDGGYRCVAPGEGC